MSEFECECKWVSLSVCVWVCESERGKVCVCGGVGVGILFNPGHTEAIKRHVCKNQKICGFSKEFVYICSHFLLSFWIKLDI